MKSNSSNTAFLFPGVGAQYTGMSKTLYDNFDIFKKTIEEAEDVLKLDISGMSYTPDRKKELDQLENAQCILVAFSTASYRVFMQEIGLQPDYCLGHSLGEYSALVGAGMMAFADALRLVKERGKIINEAAAHIDGTMAWVINLDIDIVEAACRDASTGDKAVYISAYDSPTQSSISGHSDVLMSTAKELEQKGAIVYPLKLSGPFHSPLMQQAADRMHEVLANYPYASPRCEVITNRSAQPYAGPGSVVENLSLQLISPIRWRASLEYLLEQGVNTAIEMGPKNVLKFLMQKNTRDITTYTTDKQADFDLLKKELVISPEDYTDIIEKCFGAAVSTRNRVPDNPQYQEQVVLPYRGVETPFRELQAAGKEPEKSLAKQALQMLQTVMDGKQVPADEKSYWWNWVLGPRNPGTL